MHSTRMTIGITAVAVFLGGTAVAQDKQKPEVQYKLPAQQIQQQQIQKEATKEKEGDTAKKKESGQDPAGAVTPSDLKENKAVSPSDLKENEAISPSDLKEQVRPDLRQKLPREPGGKQAIDDESDGPSGPRPGFGDTLPKDAGRPDLPGPGERGGFTPPAGGFTAGCDGPDPAVTRMYIRKLSSPDSDEGRYNFWLYVHLKNVGQQDFVSGPNQASLTIKRGNRVIGRHVFDELRAGVNYAGITPDAGPTISNWSHGEFAEGLSAKISYDPDIRIDGNPDNDDCNMGNNEVRKTAEEVASDLGIGG